MDGERGGWMEANAFFVSFDSFSDSDASSLEFGSFSVELLVLATLLALLALLLDLLRL